MPEPPDAPAENWLLPPPPPTITKLLMKLIQ